MKLIWLIGEKEIDDSQFTNEYLKESNTQQSVLTLDDVEIADTGSYSCLTVNRGSASSVSVNIFGRFSCFTALNLGCMVMYSTS